MMAQMHNIIRREKAKSDRIARTDLANGFQSRVRQLRDYVGEVAIVNSPQRN